jgi:hypothetical protein
LGSCVKCGAKLPKYAAYCSTCGASQETRQAVVATTQNHRDLSIILVLAGGTLGSAFSLFALMMIPFFASTVNYDWMIHGWSMMGRYSGYGMMGYPRLGLYFGGVMLLWALFGLIGGILALYSGLKLRSDYGKVSAAVGIIGSILLLITFSWLPGLIALAGSIIAYVE